MSPVRINLTPRVVPGQRIDAVDELKGLAIILVIVYHAGAILGIDNVMHGEIGVDIFLMMSGFTLALGSPDISLGQFFIRRFSRIYPSYWVALGVTLVIQWKLYGTQKSWENIWQHIIGIHAFSRLAYFADIVDAFWFVSMILAAYVVFALIRKRLDDLSLVIAVAGFLTALASYLYIRNSHAGGLISLAVRIPSFFVGIIAGQLLGHGTGELKFNLLLGFGLICFYYQTFILSIADNYTLPAVGIITLWIGLRGLLRKVPGWVGLSGAFAFVGLISYELYLFHQPLIRDYNIYVYGHVLGVPEPTHRQLFVGAVVGLAVAFVVSIFLHKAMSWLLSFIPGRPKLPATEVPA